MIIKKVIIETDNGEEITMELEKVEAFFDSVERMKLAADPEKRMRQKKAEADRDMALQELTHQMELERYRCEHIIRQQEIERQLTQRFPPQVTSGTFVSNGIQDNTGGNLMMYGEAHEELKINPPAVVLSGSSA